MSDFETSGEIVRAQVDAFIDERMQWLGDAVEILAGDRSLNPLDALPAATVELESARRDEADPMLSPEDEQKLREIAGRFGIGGESDVVGDAPHRIAEGGLVWKVEAELENMERVPGLQTMILAGSPHRTIRDDEVDYVQGKFGDDISGKTEYEMVRWLIEQRAGFISRSPQQDDKDLGFGYQIDAQNTFVEGATGQLLEIGSYFGRPVLLLSVDREIYFDEEAQAERYRYQPDSAALMRFIGNVLTVCGDNASGVGLDTSTTYAARQVDTIRAGLRDSRAFDVGMYGRQTLADVQGKPAKEPTEIFQIPGELFALCEKLLKLRDEIQQ